MKKLSILLTVLLLFTFTSHQSFAKTSSESATPKVMSVQYELPYPGILPDSPLYFLKALRDNVLGFFITDSLKKAEYNLLMSDKRLTSAKALIDKGNGPLAITTLSKSGNYFDNAIQKAAKAKQQGEDANPILDKLLTASQKHQEVIYQMKQKTKGDIRYNLELLQIRAKNFQDTVVVVKGQ